MKLNRFFLGVMISLIFVPCAGHAYEEYGYLNDGNKVTVNFEANISRKFIFAPEIDFNHLKIAISHSVRNSLTEVNPAALRKDKYVLGFPLKEELNDRLEFHGYKATDVKIVSVKTERTCNGKVCSP